MTWHPGRDSNPCHNLERVVSWSTRRPGREEEGEGSKRSGLPSLLSFAISLPVGHGEDPTAAVGRCRAFYRIDDPSIRAWHAHIAHHGQRARQPEPRQRSPVGTSAVALVGAATGRSTPHGATLLAYSITCQHSAPRTAVSAMRAMSGRTLPLGPRPEPTRKRRRRRKVGMPRRCANSPGRGPPHLARGGEPWHSLRPSRDGTCYPTSTLRRGRRRAPSADRPRSSTRRIGTSGDAPRRSAPRRANRSAEPAYVKASCRERAVDPLLRARRSRPPCSPRPSIAVLDAPSETARSGTTESPRGTPANGADSSQSTLANSTSTTSCRGRGAGSMSPATGKPSAPTATDSSRTWSAWSARK